MREGNSFVSKSWNFNKLPKQRQNQINNQVGNSLMGAVAIATYTDIRTLTQIHAHTDTPTHTTRHSHVLSGGMLISVRA